MKFLKFIILMLLVILSFQKTEAETKKSEENQQSVLSTIYDKWNNFTQSLSDMLSFKEKEPDTFTKQINEFQIKVSEYLKKKIPNENFKELIDTFSKKITDMSKTIAKSEDKTKKMFMDKFNDFVANFTKYIEDWFTTLSKSKDIKTDAKDYLSTSMDKVLNYFNSNYTDFKEYFNWLDQNKTKSDVKPVEKTFPNDKFRYFIHWHEYFFYPSDRASCQKEQTEKCNHLCQEDNKVLCGCYVHKEKDKPTVDCVCAESQLKCDIKHTHVSGDKKKDIL